MDNITRLFNLKMPVKVYEVCSDGSQYFTVDHLDGMYSYGKTEKGGVVHLIGGAPLKKYKDGYKIDSEKK